MSFAFVGDRDRDLARDLLVGLRDRAVGFGDDRRHAGVGLLADADVERQAAEERHAVVGAHLLAAARRRRCARRGRSSLQTCRLMFSTTPRIGMPTFSNILQALPRIEQRDVLRRRHDHGAGHRHLLRQRQLDVAGAGRHVDDQVVEVAPVRLLEQLRQRLRDDRAAPHHRLVGIDQEADRDRLDAVTLHRLHRLAVVRLAACRRCRASSAATGRRCRRRAVPTVAPSAASASARLTAVVLLPTPPLPDAIATMLRMFGHRLRAALHDVRDDLRRDVDADRRDAFDRAQRGLDALADRVHLARGRIAELDVERDVRAGGRRVDPQVADRLRGGEIAFRCSDRPRRSAPRGCSVRGSWQDGGGRGGRV